MAEALAALAAVVAELAVVVEAACVVVALSDAVDVEPVTSVSEAAWVERTDTLTVPVAVEPGNPSVTVKVNESGPT